MKVSKPCAGINGWCIFNESIRFSELRLPCREKAMPLKNQTGPLTVGEQKVLQSQRNQRREKRRKKRKSLQDMSVNRVIFFLCILGFVFLEISSGHIFTELMLYQETNIWQAYIVLGFGAFTFSDGSMRERATLDVLFLWVLWIFLSDWVSYVSPVFASIETGALIALLSWVYFRPYRYAATPLQYGTVYIAFYGGRSAPFLSRMAANFGFPFSSIAIIANKVAVRPSKSRGCMVEITPLLLEQRGYIFVNTGVQATDEILKKLKSVLGSKTGYGFFRIKCLQNFLPVLKEIGPEWVPKDWPVIPSLYYRQCIEFADIASGKSLADQASER